MSPAVVFDSAGTLMKTVRAVFSVETGTVIPDVETTLLVFEDKDRSLVLLNAGNSDIFAEAGDTLLSSWIFEKGISYAVSCGGADMQTASAILKEEKKVRLSDLQAAARVCRAEAEKGSRLFAMNTGLILNTRLSAVEFLVAAAGYPFPGVKELMVFLQEENVPVYIASGDRQEKLEAAAALLGIEKSRVTGAATPEKKAEVVRGLQEQGPVIMVGDGINDLPALRQADFGVLTLQQKGRRPDILFDAADAVIENICAVKDIVRRFL